MPDNARFHDRPPRSDDSLCQWAERWKQEYVAWEAAMRPGRPAAAEGQRTMDSEHLTSFTEMQRILIEQLWMLLAEDLRKEADSWRYRWIASDIESRAQALLAHIVLALPRLHIDPSQNVRHLLLTIAKRRAIDEYRDVVTHRRLLEAEKDDTSNTVSAASSMAPAPGSDLSGLDNISLLTALVDPKSVDAEDRMVMALDQQTVLDHVWAYWEDLEPLDSRIMRLRWWQCDPPRPFASVAQQLGPGWDAVAVRQRHHRVMEQTRRYLREHDIHLAG